MATLSAFLPPNISSIVDVVRDFGAVADAVVAADGTVTGTDNTTAFRNAVAAAQPHPATSVQFGHVVYVPAGKYMISGRIDWKGVDGNYCSNVAVWGEHVDTTEVILKDAATGYGSSGSPNSMFFTASQGSINNNAAFKNSFRYITMTVGAGNPGAVAVDMNVSNYGGMRDVHLRSVDPSRVGVAGLLLTRAWPGPALFDNVIIDGFNVGVDVGNYQYGVTFEHLTVRNQLVAGVRNDQNSVGIRDLNSSQRNGVPAVLQTTANAFTSVIEANLGNSGTTGTAAIDNTTGGSLRLRNIRSTGYTNKLANKTLAGVSENYTPTQLGDLDEWINGGVTTLFPGQRTISLGLPIAECPRYYDTNSAGWANVMDFGAVHGGALDQGGAIQAALDSGASTIYFPAGPPGTTNENGYFSLKRNLTVPPTVKRITAFMASLQQQTSGWPTNQNVFTILDGTSDPLFIENLVCTGTSGYNFSNTISDVVCTIGSTTITTTAGTFQSGWSGYAVSDGTNDANTAFPYGTLIDHVVDAHTAVVTQPATVAGTRLVRFGGNYQPAGGLVGGHWIEHAAARPLILDEVSLGGGSAIGAYFRSGCGPVHIKGSMMSWYQEPGTRVWGRGVNMELPPGRRITNDGGDCWMFGLKTERIGTVITTINGGRTEVEQGYVYSGPPDINGEPAFINIDSSHSLSWTGFSFQQYHSAFVNLVEETQNGVTNDFPHSASQRRVNGYTDVMQLHVGRLGA